MSNPSNNYKEVNRHSWNSRLEAHLNSAFYDMEQFMKGKTSLNPIEIDLLGDVKGKRILHLQCHFGQDTISLSRMGAHVVGVDLSDQAIAKARELAKEMHSTAEFICCDIYDLDKHLDQTFDYVFTSYGTIIWLPDLDRWATIISRYLKPHGRFILVDFHPVVWMFDDKMDKIGYPYFNEEPILETEHGTYADKAAPIELTTITWNHSLSEVFTHLLKHNIHILNFQEFDHTPYNVLHNMEEVEKEKYRVQHIPHAIPLLYSLVGVKCINR